jgi:acetyltransferase-like isoleucine patch superfamily enzyme
MYFITKTRNKIISLLKSSRLSLRYFIVNRHEGVCVSSELAFLAKDAKFQMNPGGCLLGGTIRIHAKSYIMDGVIIAPYGGDISIDENVFIGPYSVLYGHGGLTIGKNVMIAAHCILIPSNHKFSEVDIPICYQTPTNLGIHIDEDVWIGAGVKILDGVSIGQGCVVGAGAVVNKSLPAYSIAVGVPAKVIGKREKDNSSYHPVAMSVS